MTKFITRTIQSTKYTILVSEYDENNNIVQKEEEKVLIGKPCVQHDKVIANDYKGRLHKVVKWETNEAHYRMSLTDFMGYAEVL